MDTDESPLPSNHDRQDAQLANLPTHGVEDKNLSNEISRPIDESRESNRTSDNVSLESLQKDMGDAFLLCKSSKTLISSVLLCPFYGAV